MEEQLARLERSVRNLRKLVIALSGAFVFLLLGAQSRSSGPGFARVMKAQAFEVVTEDGQTRGVFGLNPKAQRCWLRIEDPLTGDKQRECVIRGDGFAFYLDGQSLLWGGRSPTDATHGRLVVGRYSADAKLKPLVTLGARSDAPYGEVQTWGGPGLQTTVQATLGTTKDGEGQLLLNKPSGFLGRQVLAGKD